MGARRKTENKRETEVEKRDKTVYKEKEKE